MGDLRPLKAEEKCTCPRYSYLDRGTAIYAASTSYRTTLTDDTSLHPRRDPHMTLIVLGLNRVRVSENLPSVHHAVRSSRQMPI